MVIHNIPGPLTDLSSVPMYPQVLAMMAYGWCTSELLFTSHPPLWWVTFFPPVLELVHF